MISIYITCFYVKQKNNNNNNKKERKEKDGDPIETIGNVSELWVRISLFLLRRAFNMVVKQFGNAI